MGSLAAPKLGSRYPRLNEEGQVRAHCGPRPAQPARQCRQDSSSPRGGRPGRTPHVSHHPAPSSGGAAVSPASWGSFSRHCLRACEPAPPHGVTSLSSVCASHTTQGRPSGDQPRPHVSHRGPCTGPLKELQAGTFNPPRTWPCPRALPRHTPSLGTPPQRDAAGARSLSTRRDDPAVSTAHLTPSSGRLFVPRLPGDP